MIVSEKTTNTYKKTIMTLGICFIAAMVLLTFFSGTLNNISLPKVSLSSPSADSLQKIIIADGAFAPKEIVNVNLDVAGKIKEVLVEAGDVVKAGDVLAKLDMTDLENQIKTEQNSLIRMENNRDKTAMYLSPNYTQQNLAITQAKEKLARDKADLAEQKTIVAADRANITRLTKDLADAKAAGSADTDKLTQDLNAAKQALTIDLEKQDTLAQQVSADNNDIRSKNAALSQQKKQDANQKKSNTIDLSNADLDIKTQKEKIAQLEAQLKENSEIRAKLDGRIQVVNVQAGANATTGQPIMTMLNTGKGLEYTIDVSNANAELMTQGTKLDIHLTGTTQSIFGTVREKKNSVSQPGQMMTVYFDTDTEGVIANNVQPNQKGDIRFTQNTESYELTLPNSAIREDSSGYYVLIPRQKKTPLGTKNVLYRVDVNVLDSDNFRSAIEGALSQREQVVSNSDKAVSENEVVQIVS